MDQKCNLEAMIKSDNNSISNYNKDVQLKDLTLIIANELKTNKNILFGIINYIEIVPQNDVDDGSDSNPSEDDIDSKEIAKVIPAELHSEISNNINTGTKNTNKKFIVISQSSIVKLKPFNEFSLIPKREKRKVIKYVEMVNSWTQTPCLDEK